MFPTSSLPKRKLTDFLTSPTARRPRLDPPGAPSSLRAADISSPVNCRTQTQHGIGRPNVKRGTHDSTASNMSTLPAGPPLPQLPPQCPPKRKSPEFEGQIRPEPNLEKHHSSVPRYHHPRAPPEEAEIIMRKYYPSEMSNERAELYKSGALSKPIDQLTEALSSTSLLRSSIPVKDTVVHWFRGDLRIADNHALYLAGQKANAANASLITLFVISPQDYEAHIKSPARVDFILRSLKILQNDLDKLNIPLYATVVENRKDMAKTVLLFLTKWNASHLYGNMEYEVDELRRDAKIVKMAADKGVDFTIVHDSIITSPDVVKTKRGGKPFTVFTPWFNSWTAYLHDNPHYLNLYPPPQPNAPHTRTAYAELFKCPIPSALPSHTLDPSEVDFIHNTWPAGEQEALSRLNKFLDVKVSGYKDCRDFPRGNGTSALSVHFAAGTLSSRTAIRLAMERNERKRLDSGNEGICTWISELGWREFYRNVLINFPWVCMSKPFKTEYSNIPWNYDPVLFHAWCTGTTGYPIIDAAMRQLVTLKYMHNRTRMIAASFLTKDLCLDWRLGERFFMSHLIDGDFASNNGGWQWSSSSGCDPQPYFRIFNPLMQSERFDPEGEYIRTWVSELRDVKGKGVHAPFERLDKKAWSRLEKMGYPRPIVKHHEAKERALEMYKAGLGKQKP